MSTAVARSSSDNGIKFDFRPQLPSTTVIKKVKFSRKTFDEKLAAFRGLGRGPGYQSYTSGGVLLYSLAEMFARRVAGKHNKNVIFILFGDLGSGKSMTLLKLALSCAMWLAKLKGGRPSDYFTFKNVAVIDPEMLQEKMSHLQPYEILILDDAGPGYDARTFMSKQNRDLNYILQTCRTTNNIILVSAPHGAMLDVTIHRVAQYYAEVAESRHEQGISFVKVFRLVRVFREGKIFYVYMTKSGVTIKRFWVTLPPKQLKDHYDVVRDAQAKIIQERKAKRDEEERMKHQKSPGTQALEWLNPDILVKLRKMCQDNPETPQNTLMNEAGVSHTTISRVLEKAGIRNVGTSRTKKVWEVSSVWGDVQKPL
jgi:hypothetical protein